MLEATWNLVEGWAWLHTLEDEDFFTIIIPKKYQGIKADRLELRAEHMGLSVKTLDGNAVSLQWVEDGQYSEVRDLSQVLADQQNREGRLIVRVARRFVGKERCAYRLIARWHATPPEKRGSCTECPDKIRTKRPPVLTLVQDNRNPASLHDVTFQDGVGSVLVDVTGESTVKLSVFGPAGIVLQGTLVAADGVAEAQLKSSGTKRQASPFPELIQAATLDPGRKLPVGTYRLTLRIPETGSVTRKVGVVAVTQ